MFGIGDSCGTTDGVSKYCHGEVVGIPIEGIQGDFRAEITVPQESPIPNIIVPFFLAFKQPQAYLIISLLKN
jgi:hypothetical protein